MGNKIFTVLSCNLTHCYKQHFNHRKITEYAGLAKREYRYLPVGDITPAHLCAFIIQFINSNNNNNNLYLKSMFYTRDVALK